MRTLSGPVASALAQPVVGLAQLIRFGFSPTPVLLATSSRDLVYGGETYKGAAGLGSFGAVDDAPGEIKGLQFSISGVAAASIALALDEADEWQGVPIEIRTCVLDPVTYQVLDAPLEWQGFGDTMSIAEDETGVTITATAESGAVDLLRGAPLTYSDADQQMLYPGDLAFQ